MTNATVSPDMPAQLDRFLSPESMITPGFAASFIVVIASALDKVLYIDPIYCALALSALISIAVAVSSKHGHPVARFIYTVLNALFIFAMAVGGATLLDSRASAAEPSADRAGVSGTDAGGPATAGRIVLAAYGTTGPRPAAGPAAASGTVRLAADDRPFVQQWVLPNASRRVDPVIGVRVRIFYCCGRDGTARRVEDLLTARGADVLERAVTPRGDLSGHAGTVYYYRDSHRKEASEIAELLSGIGTFQVREGGGLYNRLTNAVSVYLPPS